MKTYVREDPQLAFNLPGDDVGQHERALNSNRRVLILAYSQIKTPDGSLPTRGPVAIPALLSYDGLLWQTLRAIHPHVRKTHVAFLSAHHGFRRAEVHIRDYGERLTPEIAARLIAAGVNTNWPPDARRWNSFAIAEISMMGASKKKPILDVALVSGKLYLEVMRSFVAEFQRWRLISPSARVTEINGPIGLMHKGLRAWVQYPPARSKFEELVTVS